LFVSPAASFAQAPENDLCIDAIDINEIFSTEIGEQLNVGPFSNVEATGESELAAGLVDDWFDPLEGETLPSVDQSVWFRFTGNGETYQITTYNGPGAAMYASTRKQRFIQASFACRSRSNHQESLIKALMPKSVGAFLLS
jgi:hypothetical protein